MNTPCVQPLPLLRYLNQDTNYYITHLYLFFNALRMIFATFHVCYDSSHIKRYISSHMYLLGGGQSYMIFMEWCSSNRDERVHYISVKEALRHLRPSLYSMSFFTKSSVSTSARSNTHIYMLIWDERHMKRYINNMTKLNWANAHKYKKWYAFQEDFAT